MRISCSTAIAALAGVFAMVLSASAAAPVSVAETERRPVMQVVMVSGTVTSPQSAVLSPSVGGLIERIDVDAGDRVEAGALVVALDRELGDLSLERARADKRADGIIDSPVVAVKRRGRMEPDWSIPLSGGEITRW